MRLQYGRLGGGDACDILLGPCREQAVNGGGRDALTEQVLSERPPLSQLVLGEALVGSANSANQSRGIRPSRHNQQDAS